MTHPNVLEAAVVGREDDKGLIKPQAFVVLKDGVEPTEMLADELKQHVKTSLLQVKYPRWIEFTPDLPKTATGKIQRYRLRERLSKQVESDLEGRASDGASQS
jgi:benzoate-CoA ligase